jgi:zinc protease
MAVEDQNRQSNSRADEYVRNFLTDEPLPGIELEQALQQRYLPEITLQEINAIAKEWFKDGNRFVIVTAPDKPGLVMPDEAKLAAAIKAASSTNVTAYVDTVTSAALLDPLPAPGSVVKTATKDAIGITEWELSNGVKVVLKPTTFREDEIVFRAFSPGGTSLASDADYIPASTAAQLLSAGGLGQFSAIELRKAMTGKVANVGANIGETEETLNGSASRKDLETLFQLIYLKFTQPRADKDAFMVQSTQAKTALANQAAVPEFAFAEALTNIFGQNNPRRRIMTAATVDQWNLDKSLAFYKDRFADASDFTFVFVGSFDVATMKPLVERYLGGLPSLHRQETWKDVGPRLPTGVIEKTVEKGIEPKSQTAIIFSGPFEYDPPHRIAMRAMTSIFQSRLLDVLREELGGTYTVSVNGGSDRIPRPEYQVSIRFGGDPQRVEGLVKRVFEEVEKYKANGPTEKELEDEKAGMTREFETSSKQNGFLLGQISAKYQSGEDVAGIWAAPELYQKLDVATIQTAAKTYLDTSNYVRVTLLPEKK